MNLRHRIALVVVLLSGVLVSLVLLAKQDARYDKNMQRTKNNKVTIEAVVEELKSENVIPENWKPPEKESKK